jgi:lactoylglutathione lyase
MKPNLAEFTEQFGLILFVEKFHECEKFYAETIGLRILYRKESLTTFEFGDGYLMLEAETCETRNAARRPFVIRLNVRDLVGATKYLEHQGVESSPIALTGVRLLYLPTRTETDANSRRLQRGSDALVPGRRVYPNATAANGFWRRPACGLTHGMQRPSDFGVDDRPLSPVTRLRSAFHQSLITNHHLTHTSHFSPITSHHSTRFPLAHGRLLTLLLHRSERQSAYQLFLREPSHDHDWGDS